MCIRDSLSEAGAAGRIALIEAGAKLLHTDPANCSAQNGAVISEGRRITYGDIVARAPPTRAFTDDELSTLPIKTVGDRRLIGHDTRALDIPDKTDGKAVYGIDAELPGMVFARPKIPPTRNGSKVISIDDSAAKAVPGYLSSLALDDPSDTVPGWVMVLATSYPAAIRAADLVTVNWAPGPTAGVSERDIQNHAVALIAAPGGALLVDDLSLIHI